MKGKSRAPSILVKLILLAASSLATYGVLYVGIMMPDEIEQVRLALFPPPTPVPTATPIPLDARPRSAGPNIAFIMLDTLRADRVGAYGFPDAISPELDEYTRGGVQFSQVLSPTPWTRPSVAAMYTGLHPRRIGIYDELRGTLQDDAVTVPRLLQAAGYQTFGITANPNLNTVFGMAQGYDFYRDSLQVWAWMPIRDSQSIITPDTPPLAAPQLFRQTFELLQGQTHRPQFLFVNLLDIHEHDNNIPVRSEFKELLSDSHPEEAVYNRMVRQTSYDTARFLRTLLDMPGWEDAWVVMVSDHGEGLSSNADVALSGLHGHTLFASAVWVPLIVYRRGMESAGTLVDQVARVYDLAPTLLEMAGVPVPNGLDGRSLMPLLTNPKADIGLPTHHFLETTFRMMDQRAVFTPEWALFQCRSRNEGQNPIELYPIHSLERHAWDRSAQSPEVVAQLSAEIERWMRDNPRTTGSEKANPGVSKEAMEQMRSIGYLR